MCALIPRRYLCAAAGFALVVQAAGTELTGRIAYIHGDISRNGVIPSADDPESPVPFHQMLLTDTGSRGLSQFRQRVEQMGYEIGQYYDQALQLDAAFLSDKDVIIFGLHQKVWSPAEQAALDTWIHNGGGILMYNDSAAGGRYIEVGIANQTGQAAVNSLLHAYGMEVATDQGGGTRSYTAPEEATHPIVFDQPRFEGEGVSPIAVDPAAGVDVLIPLDNAVLLAGSNFSVSNPIGITIDDPEWAVIALKEVGAGRVMAIFDRQPLWNNGEGSDIERWDNGKVLERIVLYLAGDLGYQPAPAEQFLDLFFGPDRQPADEASLWGWEADPDRDGLENSIEWAFNTHPLVATRDIPSPDIGLADPTESATPVMSIRYRQWLDGSGSPGIDYSAGGLTYFLQKSTNLEAANWEPLTESDVSVHAREVHYGIGTETLTLHVQPPADGDWPAFYRVRIDGVPE